MSSGQICLNEETISHFFPLNMIDSLYFDQLQQHAIISKAKPGEVIIKKLAGNQLHHYLISGQVEVRESFNNRYSLDAGTEQAQLPLEDAISEKGIIRASKDCQLLIVNIDIVEQLKAWSQSYNYEIVHLHNSNNVSDDALINDDFDEDWSNLFIQTPLASNLSASDLHKLFNTLEDVEVKAGQTIVHHNTDGDYFYIIKSGTAEVTTDRHGPYEGEPFELSCGDFFGDEALVAETRRNASVSMKTDGLLGRLSHDNFNQIVKGALVRMKDEKSIDGSANDLYYYIDVRLPLEFRSQHHDKSENIPISHLRKKLDHMDYTKIYFITSEGGRRSELATYLMRQAGFEAYCMVG